MNFSGWKCAKIPGKKLENLRLALCKMPLNNPRDSARTNVSRQPWPIPAAITECGTAGGMGPVENVRKKKKKKGVCLAFHSTVFSSQSVSGIASSGDKSTPPTSLLSRQTVSDVAALRGNYLSAAEAL